MAKKTEILVIGTNEKIRETVLRLLNTNSMWQAMGVGTVEEAVAKCMETTYEVLLIGAGLTDELETLLITEIKAIQPSIQIIPHYGGGSGLLFAEIYLALGTNNEA